MGQTNNQLHAHPEKDVSIQIFTGTSNLPMNDFFLQSENMSVPG
jgi:hypothetical protein